MDLLTTTITIIVLLALIVFAVLCFWRTCVMEQNDFDVRVGHWMNDAVFRARWKAPFDGGFRGMRFPGVTCVMLGARLDGTGRPLSCEECMVVITDDVTRTTMDVLTGVFDGEAFPYAGATVAMWRRLGNAQELARYLVVTYGADGAYVVEHRRKHYVQPSGLGVPEAVSTPTKHVRKGLPAPMDVAIDKEWENTCLAMR